MPRTRFPLLMSTGLVLALALTAPGCRSVPTSPPAIVAPPTPPIPVERTTARPVPVATTIIPEVEPADLPPLSAEKSTDSDVQKTEAADRERMADVKPTPAPVHVAETWESALARVRELAAAKAEGDGDWELATRMLARLEDPAAIRPDWRPALRAFADGEGPPAPPAPAPALLPETEPPAPAAPSFEVAELRLCREVRGFGDYDPIEGDGVAPGEALVLYAEVANVGDREEGGLHRSTLRPRLELRPVGGGEPAWSEDLGPVEDACRRRRRDCFVNARLAIPAGLAPGAYTLRFAAVDAADGAEAHAEVAVTVRR